MKSHPEIESAQFKKQGLEANPGMRSFAPPAFQLKTNEPLQKKESSEEKEETSQMKEGNGPEMAVASPPAENNGSGLPTALQTKMEGSMGADFSNVNVHQNSGTASDIGALAYTQGNDVHFAPGQFKPDTSSGQELIGHELAHVVQQRQGRVQPTSMAGGMPANEDPGLENEADVMGRKAARSSGNDAPVQQKENPSSSAHAPMQFRLPTFASLQAQLTADPSMEPVLRDRVTVLLNRMAAENRLLSTDPVPVIVARIFPGGGVMDEPSFNAAVDVSDRGSVYVDARDAEAPIQSAQKARFKQALRFAVSVARTSASMNRSLERIFGTKTPQAKTIYADAATILENLRTNDALLDTVVSTDYNQDDPESFLGGWAWNDGAGTLLMHLTQEVVQVTDLKDSTITLIHEACHLAGSGVHDLGYYPPSTNEDAFAAMDEDTKIGNAAHFEEFPRRWLDRSVYPHDRVFTPGTTASGAPLSREAQVRQQAGDFFENNWDHALNHFDFFRRTRVEILGGDNSGFNAEKANILAVSRIMGLTVHEQPAATATITDLDLTLAEGIGRSCSFLQDLTNTLPVPAVATDADIPAAVQQLIQDALTARPTLSSLAEDQTLMTYLDTHTNI
ncbi:MAG: DUF4157 domain-containing protein [Bacteroidia bacterium]|nr:DUF4157 domain-containing protein [Bacteroidia bacterium]